MKLSARNTLPGTIRKIERGAVNAEVTIELAPGLNVVSVITLDAVDSLALKEGRKAYAVIKASSVMVAPTSTRPRRPEVRRTSSAQIAHRLCAT